MPTYLKKRNRKYHFQKRVPKEFQKFFKQSSIQVSLKTECQSIALQRAYNLNLTLNDFWETAHYNTDELALNLQSTLSKANKSQFQYMPKSILVDQASLYEFVNRINSASAIKDNPTKEIILGGAQPSTQATALLEASEAYYLHEEGNLTGHSEDQLRKWKNPRKKAVKNFNKCIGQKQLSEITRQDVLDFRAWWIERIQKEGLSANSANKEFGFIRQILNYAIDNYMLDIPVEALFKGVALKRIEKKKRYPFTTSFINEKLLNNNTSRLNSEAQLMIHAMADTGARIGELTGLEERDIVLNNDIPHIIIRPNSTRALKTPQSERELPLVGASLHAFQRLKGPFIRYFGKPDLISNTINKYYRDNNLFPSENHSLYSLRHSFEDRLTALEPPDKVQAALMGHKYARPRYGDGPSLAQKRIWLDKIAFQI